MSVSQPNLHKFCWNVDRSDCVCVFSCTTPKSDCHFGSFDPRTLFVFLCCVTLCLSKAGSAAV